MKQVLSSTFVFLLSLTGVSSEANASAFFKCKAVSFKVDINRSPDRLTTFPAPRFKSVDDQGLDIGGIVVNDLAAICKARGKYFGLYFAGLGPAASYTNDYFTVACPLVKFKRFDRKKGASFLAITGTATAGVGVVAGAAVNALGGVCTLQGVTLGAGARIGVGAMKIKPINPEWGVQDGLSEILD